MPGSIVYLEIEEVLLIHERMLEYWGGKPGVRDQGLLDSALNRPRFKAHYESAGLMAQAGSLMFGLTKNHPFHDGNKRTAAATTDVFLQENGHELACDNDTLADFLLGCSDASFTEETCEAFVRAHARPLAL